MARSARHRPAPVPVPRRLDRSPPRSRGNLSFFRKERALFVCFSLLVKAARPHAKKARPTGLFKAGNGGRRARPPFDWQCVRSRALHGCPCYARARLRAGARWMCMWMCMRADVARTCVRGRAGGRGGRAGVGDRVCTNMRMKECVGARASVQEPVSSNDSTPSLIQV